VFEDRVRKLNKSNNESGDYVIYWMHSAMRTVHNHSLEFAVSEANRLKKPLLVLFCLMKNYPSANNRHFRFLIEGIKDVKENLKNRGIRLYTVESDSPVETVCSLGKKACVIVIDAGYLKHHKEWMVTSAAKSEKPVYSVQSNIVVPVQKVSDKEEYSAATLRRKITPLIDNYLYKRFIYESLNDKAEIDLQTTGISEIFFDYEISETAMTGGEIQAEKVLNEFINERLSHYEEKRNDPAEDYQSGLSPYLHFGHISPVKIASAVSKTDCNTAGFLEELIVRRELAINFVTFNSQYDNLKCLHSWAYETLQQHKNDMREYLYKMEHFESALTHDDAWNAAQAELLKTGKMHGYMRMYWCKKIIEWTESPEEALEISIYLNDKYSMDGRDPNGYAGILWSFGKHDRPWKERNIFGKVRYMNYAGLKRKFDIQKYIDRISKL